MPPSPTSPTTPGTTSHKDAQTVHGTSSISDAKNGTAPPTASGARAPATVVPDVEAALAQVPGIGPATSARLLKAMGGSAAVMAAAAEGDVVRFAAVQGIGERRAIEIVRHLRAAAAGAARGGAGDDATAHDGDRLFGTSRVRRVFEHVRDRIVERAATESARNQLRLMGPLPTRAARDEQVDAALAAAAEVEGVDLALVRRHLKKIHPLPDRKPAYEATVAVYVDSPADHKRLVEAGIDRWAPILSARDRESRRADRAEAGVYAYSAGDSSLLDADHVLTVPFTTDPVELVPWAETMRWQRARGSLEAAAALSDLRAMPSAAAEALDVLSGLEGLDKDFDPSRLEGRVQEVYEEALVEAEKALEALTLTGKELVRALSDDAPPSVKQAYHEAMRAANQRLRSETGVDVDAFTDAVPPQVDEAAVQAARRRLIGRGAIDRLQVQAKTAKRLAALQRKVEDEIADHLRFDARQALGDFVREHALARPSWGPRLVLRGALHLDHSPSGERVDYELGEPHRLALLTGANSGGKTTLLETVCQVLTMAHAGLPVPATAAEVPELDTVHFFAQRRSLSAGAFEDFLIRFFPVATDEGRVLVLADEVEAMTELEAAAEIIASFLERLHRRDAFAVFVSHMGPHVLPLVKDIVRVDGIEATGLDESHRLIVSRTPRLGYMARSTPELILRRLANAGPVELRETFRELAERVRLRDPTAAKADPMTEAQEGR